MSSTHHSQHLSKGNKQDKDSGMVNTISYILDADVFTFYHPAADFFVL